MRVPAVGALLAIVLTGGFALAGTLRTLDGKTYHGEVRVDEKGGLTVGKGAAAVHVELDAVLQATLVESAKPATDAPPAGGRPVAGVVLRGGTVIAGQVRQLDEKQVRLSRARGADLAIPAAQVARIYYRTMSAELAGKIPSGRTGVLLAGGDFAEGEVKAADDGTIRLSSLIFGLRRFEQRETAAVVLQEASPVPAEYFVTTVDGSTLLAKSLRLQNQEVLVEDQTLGAVKVAAAEVVEIRAGAVRFCPLIRLRPEKSEGDGGRPGYVIDATTTRVPMVLGQAVCEHGIGMTAGGSVTYKLDQAYKSLNCRAGVPAGVLPATAVRFIVAVDGKVVYRSTDRTSMDEPLGIVVGLSGARMVTLRMEPAGVGEVGASGLWGDPALVR